MNITWLKLKGQVKGLFQTIPYNPLLPNGDSSPYFGTYEGQKYGHFDTSDCWDFSACELAETRLEMFWKMNLIPQDTKDWLTKNGYIDADGDFYLSRRWVAILSGVRDAGNSPLDFWHISSSAGLIPNSMLPYNPKDAQKWVTQDQFNNEYFNIKVLTPEMMIMGQEFIRRFKIMAENLPGGFIDDISVTLQTYLKEGTLQIGHPVPQDGSWNQVSVLYPKGRMVSDHATELYKFDPVSSYPFSIYDSYEPHLKNLSKNYYIPLITRVSIIPIPTPVVIPSSSSLSEWQKFWHNVMAWLRKLPLPYPSVPIGYA